jgi:hypothetical protein
MTTVWRLERGVPTEGSVVTAAIDGIEVTALSADAPLRSTVEAWATAFALPAARAGATLVPDGPIDARWARGAAANVALCASWWGGAPDLPIDARRSRAPWRPRRPAAGRALCFTGGVDSFFSLLRGDHRPTHLLYVQGFDVRLGDELRAAAVDALVRAVAADRGLQPVIVRTDLLDHARFSAISWEHTHGAALAAVAQLLAPTIGTVIVPPSYASERLVPWGSRPDTDPRWSVPGRTTIVHGDASGRRLDRVRAIAEDPLVHRHLRVCWANVGDDLNCGRCEKCVRTMAMLSSVGQLAASTTFPTSQALAEAIDALDALPPGIIPLWADLLPLGLPADERAAIERLLARSG